MTTINKITIPIIRQAFPATIAQQIAGVQPMSNPCATAHSYYEWTIPRSDYTESRMIIIYNNKGEEHTYHRDLYMKVLMCHVVFVYTRDTRTFACFKDRAGLSRPATYLEELKIPITLIDDGSRYKLDDTPSGMLAAMKYGL